MNNFDNNDYNQFYDNLVNEHKNILNLMKSETENQTDYQKELSIINTLILNISKLKSIKKKIKDKKDNI